MIANLATQEQLKSVGGGNGNILMNTNFYTPVNTKNRTNPYTTRGTGSWDWLDKWFWRNSSSDFTLAAANGILTIEQEQSTSNATTELCQTLESNVAASLSQKKVALSFKYNINEGGNGAIKLCAITRSGVSYHLEKDLTKDGEWHDYAAEISVPSNVTSFEIAICIGDYQGEAYWGGVNQGVHKNHTVFQLREIKLEYDKVTKYVERPYEEEYALCCTKALQTEVSDLKKSVSDGKSLVASAITDKNVSLATNPTFQQIHDAIKKDLAVLEPLYFQVKLAGPASPETDYKLGERSFVLNVPKGYNYLELSAFIRYVQVSKTFIKVTGYTEYNQEGSYNFLSNNDINTDSVDWNKKINITGYRSIEIFMGVSSKIRGNYLTIVKCTLTKE